MLIDSRLWPIKYTDEDIVITKEYPNIGNDGTDDYLIDVLNLIDTEIGGMIQKNLGSLSNRVVITDGTNGNSIKASDIVIDNNGYMSVGGSTSSAMVDITQKCSCVKGFELNGATDCTCTLFQINEGNGNTGNLVEINRYGGSGGDRLVIAGEYIGINNTDPEKYLDVNGDGRIIGNFTVGFSSWSQLGNSLDVNQIYTCKMTALTTTRIVFIDMYNDKLRVYDWNGSDWTLIGNEFHISNTGYQAITSLNSTDIAFIDGNNDELRLYRFDGSDWSQIGSGLSVPGIATPALTTLNDTDVAFFDSGNDSLRTYRWNGSNWSQLGNSYDLGQTYTGTLTAITDSIIVLADNYNDRLKTFRWNGTDWSQIGNELYIACNYPALTALNNTDIAVVDNNNKELRTYRWNGTDWLQFGPSLEITGMGVPTIAKFNKSQIVYADDALDELRTYQFVHTISLSAYEDRVGIGVNPPARILDIRGCNTYDLLNIATTVGTDVLRLDVNGHMGLNEVSMSAMLDIAQDSTSSVVLELNGISHRSAPLLQLNEGSGTVVDNIFEINSNGGSDGDLICIKDGHVGVNQNSLSAMLDMIQDSTSSTVIELNGISNRSGPLLQLNEGSGTPINNIFEINSNGGSSGDLICIDESGQIGINNITPVGLIHTKTDDAQGNPPIFDYIGTSTNTISNSIILKSTKSTDMADGFGAGVLFKIEDNTSGSKTIAKIAAIRDGADDTGNVIIYPYNLGNLESSFEFSNDGYSITGTSPYITLLNSDSEDTNGGRESKIVVRGRQSGGEESTLGQIVFAHNGPNDDQRGIMAFYINDGNDDDNPSLSMYVDYLGDIYLEKGDSISTIMTELTLEQTGDNFGTSRLSMRNRIGSAGAIFQNVGLDMFDFGFVPKTGYQSNIRYEHRSDYILAGSDTSVGEFQLIENTGSYITWFATNSTATSILTGDFGIGIGLADGKCHIDQEDDSGSKPVLTLDQADVSEEFIKLIGTSTTDASQSLVDAADMTTPGSIVGWIKVYIQDDAASGAIADGIYYIPFYSVPTS